MSSEKEFEEAFRYYYRPLFLFAYGYVMSEEEAENIVQSVFAGMWENRKRLPENLNLKAYLYSSVKNSCLNYYKHLQGEDSNRTKLTEALIYVGTLEYEDNSALFEKVQECLQKLPDQQQKVLELKIFRNMSYKEIAETLGVSPKTIDYRIQQALKQLRTDLKDYLPLLLPILFP